MYKYQCIVQKQNSATHNVCWKQRFLAELSKAGYHSDGVEYTHPEAGSLRLDDWPTCYRILSETIPSSKVVKVIDSMYDYESSGVTIDKGQLLKEVGIVTAIAAGFVAAAHITAHQAAKSAERASSDLATALDGVDSAVPQATAMELDALSKSLERGLANMTQETTARAASDIGTKLSEAVGSGKVIDSVLLREAIQEKSGSLAVGEFSVLRRLLNDIDPQEVLNSCNGVITPESIKASLEVVLNSNRMESVFICKEALRGVRSQLATAQELGYSSTTMLSTKAKIAEKATETADYLKNNAKSVAGSAAGVVATSAIVSLMSNFKHKRPLIDTEHGVRVCLVIPTEKTEAEINEVLATISKDTVKGTVTPVEGMSNTYKVVAPANKLRVYMFTATKDRDNVIIQAWSHAGNGDKRKEKDFPPDINGSKIIGTSIMKTLRNLLGKKTVFENNPEVDISTDIDAAEKILELAAEVS